MFVAPVGEVPSVLFISNYLRDQAVIDPRRGLNYRPVGPMGVGGSAIGQAGGPNGCWWERYRKREGRLIVFYGQYDRQ